MYVVEFKLDCGDLINLDAYAVATVQESEHGYLKIEIKKIVAQWPITKTSKTEVNVTHLVRETVNTSVREMIEAEWQKAKSHGFQEDYDREGA